MLNITFFIFVQLIAPILSIWFWKNKLSAAVHMPEAAVYIYHCFVFQQNYIRAKFRQVANIHLSQISISFVTLTDKLSHIWMIKNKKSLMQLTIRFSCGKYLIKNISVLLRMTIFRKLHNLKTA